eukprot:11207254-Lingulodinium_polyedra.AAC.1
MEGAAATWVKFQTKVWQQATGRAYMNVDGKALWLDSMDSAECRYGPVPLPGEDHPARLVLHKVPVPVEGTLLFWQLREDIVKPDVSAKFYANYISHQFQKWQSAYNTLGLPGLHFAAS